MTYFDEISNAQKKAFLEAHTFFSNAQTEQHFVKAIPQISSLQCWLEYFVMTDRFRESVAGFFSEAVNDAILSYMFARVGTWRPALQSLRSALENTLFFLYYKDHQIELSLWANQKHRIGFSELCQYFRSHPNLVGLDHQSETGVGQLEIAYSKLSKAVHGSVESFRMVAKSPADQLPAVHVHSPVELSRYVSILKDVVEPLNLLLMGIFKESLQGTSLPALRQGIAGSLAPTRRTIAKKKFKVVLQKA